MNHCAPRRLSAPKVAAALIAAGCLAAAGPTAAQAKTLVQIKPISGEATAPAGWVTYDVRAGAGHTYEVSNDPFFHKYRSFLSGSRTSSRVAINGFKKGKVGQTTFYVRDKADRYRTVESVDMPWDFSIPYTTWGATRTVFREDGRTPYLGHFTVELSAFDTAFPGDTRGLWAELNYSKETPDNSAAFPTELADNQVVALTSRKFSVAVATPPYWARVEDAYGNKGKWMKLASNPKTTYAK
ncbi:MAG: hypothetical protein F2799_03110 [Actinobacteria bacterium]|uniref:Unannotated protein n=1 Tax=freshwater metagenome TaxID=449393 RepID=A0A6J7DJJ5_9ZZZZ|nr:hypothetical protein [Actinomycetota bacterium]